MNHSVHKTKIAKSTIQQQSRDVTSDKDSFTIATGARRGTTINVYIYYSESYLLASIAGTLSMGGKPVNLYDT